MSDQHENQQSASYSGNYQAHFGRVHPAFHYNFPPPPFPEYPIPPPTFPGTIGYRPPPQTPHLFPSYESLASFPPTQNHFITNHLQQVNNYPYPVHNIGSHQHPPMLDGSMSYGQPTSIRSENYSQHIRPSKKSLPNRHASVKQSASSLTGQEHYKTHRNSLPEDKHSVPEEYSSLTPEEIIESEKKTWTRCAPADLYYTRDPENSRLMHGTEKLRVTIERFRENLLERGEKARMVQPKFEYPSRKNRRHSMQCSGSCKEKGKKTYDSETSTSDSSSEEDEVDLVLQELERKKQHPARLHPELWFNDAGEMNDGPLCRCRFYYK